MKLFVMGGMPVDVNDNGTALIYAARSGNMSSIKILIEHGADVNQKTFWGRPLGMASYRGHLKAAEYLIEHGADVNAISGDGLTPIFASVINGEADIVELLLKNGADPNFIQPMTQDSPLIISVKKGYDRITELLVKGGADVNYEAVGGFTALDWALLDNNKQAVELLAKNNRFINGSSREIGRPLADALVRGNEAGSFELADILIKNGADINAKVYSEMPLIVWCSKRNLDKAVAFLIKHNVNLNAASQSGFTALDYALINKNKKLIELIELIETAQKEKNHAGN